MRSFVVRILLFVAVGTLLYGGFVAYERWWDGDWDALKNRAFSFAGETAEKVKEKGIEAGQAVLESAKSEAVQTAKNTFTSAVGGAIESLGETFVSLGGSVAGSSGSATGGAATEAPPVSGSMFSIPPPPVALTAKVGEELVFAVNEGTRYSVSWGDGTSDEREKSESATVLLRHAWRASGDYTVTLTTALAGSTRPVLFPVRVYE
ncbi:MAG: hypothetical protein HYU81_02995 [Candidatus Brennerbacteria bacterium]|nr:hypothetical protein [Candidatus Brennerbacteria bacterium]